jgi:hypothetical protein
MADTSFVEGYDRGWGGRVSQNLKVHPLSSPLLSAERTMVRGMKRGATLTLTLSRQREREM